jgi:hypothetical protein
MATGSHGLPKVSLGLVKPDPFTAVSGVVEPRGGQPADGFYFLGNPVPYAYEPNTMV